MRHLTYSKRYKYELGMRNWRGTCYPDICYCNWCVAEYIRSVMTQANKSPEEIDTHIVEVLGSNYKRIKIWGSSWDKSL